MAVIAALAACSGDGAGGANDERTPRLDNPDAGASTASDAGAARPDAAAADAARDAPPLAPIPTSGIVGEPLVFEAGRAKDVQHARWTFGPRQVRTGARVAHRFDAPGTYEVEAFVVWADGSATSELHDVEIAPLPGEATLAPVEVFVRSASGQPVFGARVRLSAGPEATTDELGRASFAGVDLRRDVGVTVEAAQYAPGVGRVAARDASAEGDAVSVSVALLPGGRLAGTVYPGVSPGTLVGDDGASLRFDEVAFTFADGRPVDGPVEVRMTTLDVSEPDALAAFPGSPFADDDRGQQVFLLSGGMTSFDFSSGGEPVDWVPGTPATIRLPVSEGVVVGEGEVIPLWTLDERSGTWVQEGYGTVVEDAGTPSGFALEGDVAHFTWWNIDVPEDFDPKVPVPVPDPDLPPDQWPEDFDPTQFSGQAMAISARAEQGGFGAWMMAEASAMEDTILLPRAELQISASMTVNGVSWVSLPQRVQPGGDRVEFRMVPHRGDVTEIDGGWIVAPGASVEVELPVDARDVVIVRLTSGHASHGAPFAITCGGDHVVSVGAGACYAMDDGVMRLRLWNHDDFPLTFQAERRPDCTFVEPFGRVELAAATSGTFEFGWVEGDAYGAGLDLVDQHGRRPAGAPGLGFVELVAVETLASPTSGVSLVNGGGPSCHRLRYAKGEEQAVRVVGETGTVPGGLDVIMVTEVEAGDAVVVDMEEGPFQTAAFEIDCGPDLVQVAPVACHATRPGRVEVRVRNPYRAPATARLDRERGHRLLRPGESIDLAWLGLSPGHAGTLTGRAFGTAIVVEDALGVHAIGYRADAPDADVALPVAAPAGTPAVLRVDGAPASVRLGVPDPMRLVERAGTIDTVVPPGEIVAVMPVAAYVVEPVGADVDWRIISEDGSVLRLGSTGGTAWQEHFVQAVPHRQLVIAGNPTERDVVVRTSTFREESVGWFGAGAGCPDGAVADPQHALLLADTLGGLQACGNGARLGGELPPPDPPRIMNRETVFRSQPGSPVRLVAPVVAPGRTLRFDGATLRTEHDGVVFQAQNLDLQSTTVLAEGSRALLEARTVHDVGTLTARDSDIVTGGPLATGLTTRIELFDSSVACVGDAVRCSGALSEVWIHWVNSEVRAPQGARWTFDALGGSMEWMQVAGVGLTGTAQRQPLTVSDTTWSDCEAPCMSLTGSAASLAIGRTAFSTGGGSAPALVATGVAASLTNSVVLAAEGPAVAFDGGGEDVTVTHATLAAGPDAAAALVLSTSGGRLTERHNVFAGGRCGVQVSGAIRGPDLFEGYAAAGCEGLLPHPGDVHVEDADIGADGRPGASSPAVDGLLPVHGVAIDGTTRPVGAGSDFGAWEQ